MRPEPGTKPLLPRRPPSISPKCWPLPTIGHGASNEWVVDGSRSATGKPLLANDPHLELGIPIIWYLARITTPELTITGATAPGRP